MNPESNTHQDKKKRLVENTIALYIRMFFIMAVGLYTSRVVLEVLGIENFGVYNAVGGIVAMFSIVTASMSQAISRYLTFELGTTNKLKLHAIFCTSVNIQILMSLIIVILSESVGVWFLNAKMNIAPDRLYAANWVFQFSVMSCVINLISVPYNAALMAHEKMKALAYVGIIEAILKLAIVYLITVSFLDKLISYAFLLLVVSVIIRLIYGSYCSRHFEECHYAPILDKDLLKGMSRFTGWNFLTSSVYIVNTQGINILSNLFFGVTVNAARGITSQVEGVTKNFTNNFTTAVKPQIIKSYSSQDISYLNKLICSSSKYSYFLLLLVALPLIFETETVLRLWLKDVPVYTASFVQITMILSLIGILGDSMFTYIMATGKLKKYMIREVIASCIVFPLSYVLFTHGFAPTIPYILLSVLYGLLIFIRLWYLRETEGFSIALYLNNVLWPVFKVTATACVIPAVYKIYLEEPSLTSAITDILLCIGSFTICTFLFGAEKKEKRFFLSILKRHNS